MTPHNMAPLFELRDVTKQFDKKVALDKVSLFATDSSIIGLIGKNGSGKTTLLRTIIGLYLPTSGSCTTLGCPTPDLGLAQLARIGASHQKENLVGWMNVQQLVRYVASFYDTWDKGLERQLLAELELDEVANVGTLSPGNKQRLGILLAVCHRPRLLLLDEPFSDLDPIGREAVLAMLLRIFRESAMTIVVSSHLLFDIERIVDRVVVLHEGCLSADATLDDLKERFAEWTVRSRNGALPDRFDDEYVVSAEGDGRQALLVVRNGADHMAAFEARHNVEIQSRQLNLTRIFPLLIGQNDKPRS